MDVILGIQRLKILGDYKVNLEIQEYSFMHQGQEVKLFGDPDQQFSHLTRLEIDPMFDDDLHLEIMEYTVQPVDSVTTSIEVEKVLTLYSHVFAKPTSLTSIRMCSKLVILL